MQVGDNQYKSGSANLQTLNLVSQSEAAEMFNVSPRLVASVKDVKRAIQLYHMIKLNYQNALLAWMVRVTQRQNIYQFLDFYLFVV